MRGFGLLEVLIALLVLSTALLGLASAQIKALQQSDQAYLRVVAVWQVAAMFERLRADPIHRAQEINLWKQQNQQLLPGAAGKVGCEQQLCTVSLHWLQHSITVKSAI